MEIKCECPLQEPRPIKQRYRLKDKDEWCDLYKDHMLYIEDYQDRDKVLRDLTYKGELNSSMKDKAHKRRKVLDNCTPKENASFGEEGI